MPAPWDRRLPAGSEAYPLSTFDPPPNRPYDTWSIFEAGLEDIAIIVRDVAVLICDEPSIMEEALTKVSLDGIEYQRLGPRAIGTAAPNASALVAKFHAAGIYPRVVGQTTNDEEA